MKFGTCTISNMLNSRWCLPFQFLTRNAFLGKLSPRNQNYQFKLKFGTYSNMQHSMQHIFCVFDWEYSFWANFVEKIKIVSLSWNLVPRLIWIWRTQSSCSLFIVLGKFDPKKPRNLQFKLKLSTQKIQIPRIQ